MQQSFHCRESWSSKTVVQLSIVPISYSRSYITSKKAATIASIYQLDSMPSNSGSVCVWETVNTLWQDSIISLNGGQNMQLDDTIEGWHW